jgi:hypothetical protein
VVHVSLPDAFVAETISSVIVGGGDQRWQGPGGDRVCELLRGLLGGKIFRPELEREFLGRGIDLRALLATAAKHCDEGEEPAQAGPRLPATSEEVHRALLAIEHAAASATLYFARMVSSPCTSR